jgi:1,4-alpha-glucan branching enzyme
MCFPEKGAVMTRLKLLEIDPWLAEHHHDVWQRYDRFWNLKKALVGENGRLTDFANGHLYFGFHRTPEGFVYREWAPAAIQLYLTGDFNNWDRFKHPLKLLGHGVWEIILPYDQYAASFKHGSLVKVHVVTKNGARDRIPLYINRAVQDDQTKDFTGQLWFPEQEFQWTDKDLKIDKDKPLFIYEAHIGMAQEKEGIGTYREFADNNLPRIKKNGYNVVQLMGVMEHPYYGSFGYQVSNFFAASSRFGTPEDLKYLINKAHEMGIAVLLDLVHSHAVKNIAEGINEFDGTVYQFFHEGPKGDHPAWDSKCFDYSKTSVIHFLLSNIKYWLQEYHFDGFRFDGITSMLYHHRGLGTAFDHYKKYFSMDTDVDAVSFLQCANELIREVKPWSITIAEDMSAMPGMCLPIADGGIGFDYRLAMGVPDFWIRTLRDKSDEQWDLGELWRELTGRRPGEKNIGYAESHDQALVGDKTLIFWLIDKEMYWHMKVEDKNLQVDRGIALHKMIRLVTCALAGEGYLNFIGNEFGHPEWVDFPREGNGWSYKYAQRKWHLVDDPNLKYKYLNNFDQGMLKLMADHGVPRHLDLKELWLDNGNKILIFRKGGLVFLFNFHPNQSHSTYDLPVPEAGQYQVIFNSDTKEYGGFDRIDMKQIYTARPLGNHVPGDGITIYTPCRTAMVLKKIS